MNALQFTATGDLANLSLVEVPVPVPSAGEVLVQIKAAGLNPSDVKNVLGRFPYTTLPRIPGRDFAGVARAVVGVRGWHTERFSAATFLQAPDILRFADAKVVRLAEKRFGSAQVAKVLCLPQLPASPELRDRALAVLKERGVDGVLSFRTLLRELVAMIDVNKNYEKSDVLQTVRPVRGHAAVVAALAVLPASRRRELVPRHRHQQLE